MKVLIATGGSTDATAALRTAIRLLTPVGRNLDLLCVAPRFPYSAKGAPHSVLRGNLESARGAPHSVLRGNLESAKGAPHSVLRGNLKIPKGAARVRREDYERRILGETSQILEQARAAVGPGSVRLLTEIGSPSAVIVDRAGDYDLTVIGSGGRSGTGSAGLGPVASRVVEHAQAPVLVARELRSEGDARVLIALDGSAASLHAVETLRSLFDLGGAEICLMHVAETPWVQFGLEEDWVTYSEEAQEDSEAGVLEKEMVWEGDALIEQARDLLRDESLSITTRIDEGNPANEILSQAERGQYDLIVTGATGVRDLKHTMLGSVSSKIAASAPCSVLIVRERE